MKTNLIFAFGDSSTWGAFDLEKGGWAERLKNYFFQKREDTFVYNLGIESNTTKDLLKRFEMNYVPEYIQKILQIMTTEV